MVKNMELLNFVLVLRNSDGSLSLLKCERTALSFLNLLSLPFPSGWTCTVLLRNPIRTEADDQLRPYIDSGRVRLIQGDATNESDVPKLFHRVK